MGAAPALWKLLLSTFPGKAGRCDFRIGLRENYYANSTFRYCDFPYRRRARPCRRAAIGAPSTAAPGIYEASIDYSSSLSGGIGWRMEPVRLEGQLRYDHFDVSSMNPVPGSLWAVHPGWPGIPQRDLRRTAFPELTGGRKSGRWRFPSVGRSLAAGNRWRMR